VATRRLAKPRPVQGEQAPRSGGPPRSRVSCTERWSPSTESGLQACYGNPRKCGGFYLSVHHACITIFRASASECCLGRIAFAGNRLVERESTLCVRGRGQPRKAITYRGTRQSPRSFVKVRLVRSTGHLSGGDGLKPERRGRSVDLQAQASRIRLADQAIFERRLLRRRALHPYSGVLGAARRSLHGRARRRAPAGGYVARGSTLSRQGRLRDLCKQMLPAAPFVVAARAWAARSLAN
jgi:hypothetical protein